MKELVKICILVDCILILVFFVEEVGRYFEIYKVYEYKLLDVIMEKIEKDYMLKVIECLILVRSVNKTDVMILLSIFYIVEGVLKVN